MTELSFVIMGHLEQRRLAVPSPRLNATLPCRDPFFKNRIVTLCAAKNPAGAYLSHFAKKRSAGMADLCDTDINELRG